MRLKVAILTERIGKRRRMNFACEKSLKERTNLVGKMVSLKKKEKEFGKKDPKS
jgi:hypothetical protein